MQTTDIAAILGIPKLPDYTRQVERHLAAIVTTNNTSIRDPALRLIKGGGKRLRPFLAIAAAQSKGGTINDMVITGSAAIELVHIGSLVHDDIIDNANTRWSMPTINSKEGTNQAIIVGDYLLALALSQAASINADVASAISIAITKMCEGESQESQDTFDINRSVSSYIAAIRNKTAALTGAACRVGALCSNLAASDVETLTKYGEAFGVMFQLIDDVLDLVSTPDAIGKPVGNDLKSGTYTLPILLALQSPAGHTIKSMLKKKRMHHSEDTGIIDVVSKCGALEETMKEIRDYTDLAQRAAHSLGDTTITHGLAELPVKYVEWAFAQKVDVTRFPQLAAAYK